MSLEKERQRLTNQIREWNENRLDLFEISIPDERLEFFGVIRFFYQGDDKKYQSKCLRVTSSATAHSLVDVLIEKFHPDLKMLSIDQYGIYESHSTAPADRKLQHNERPLLVQLNWAKDDREGKFILKNETKLSQEELLNSTFPNQQASNGPMAKERRGSESDMNQSGFKKRWSSRKKKKQRTQSQSDMFESDSVPENNQPTNRPPESSFTRTISNPDEVMRRKRQQKLEARLQQLNPRDGGTEAGGALKIYGQTLNRDVPYKTLLVSVNDSANQVVKETLEKYGLETANPADYCLVQVNLPPRGEQLLPHEDKEFLLRDHECPLDILVNAPPARGTCIFEVRHRLNLNLPLRPERPPVTNGGIRLAPNIGQSGPNRGLQGPARHSLSSLGSHQTNGREPPYLMRLDPDGSDPGSSPTTIRLHGIWDGNVIRVGSHSQSVGQPPSIYLPVNHFPGVRPVHCQLRCPPTGEQCMLTPALDMTKKPPIPVSLWLNNHIINKSMPLQTGDVVRFSNDVIFRFIDPGAEQKAPVLPTQDGQQMQSPLAPRELLPMNLDYRLDQEVRILDHMVNPNNLEAKSFRFKLAPAYSLYMLVRACVRQVNKAQVSPEEREHRLMGLVNQVSDRIYQAVQSDRLRYENTTFWLANSSELLHFFKRDHALASNTHEAQDTLAAAVEQSFMFLKDLLAERLERMITAFLIPGDHDLQEDPRLDDQEMEIPPNQPLNRHVPIYQVLQCLSHAMQLLRRCRVNAALTIQLFSQMFHLINRFLFNHLLISHGRSMLCADWGHRIQRRLDRVRNWAERQGLELAAECHLQRITQACVVLTAKKVQLEEFYQLCVDQFRLNSIQLGFLLENCQDVVVPDEWIDFVVAGAKEISDRALLEEGKALTLEEEENLSLPLLLPADGYSVDMLIEGVPQSLMEFIDPLLKANILRYSLNNNSEASWTAYLTPHKNQSPGPDSMTSSLLRQSLIERSGQFEPSSINNSEQNSVTTTTNPSLSPGPVADSPSEILEIQITKLNKSLGLSIVAAKGEFQPQYGIYIKEVVTNGAAARDGRLETGDQLLAVEGVSLVGVTQDEAAKVMSRTGAKVKLTIEKGASHKHNLYNLITQHQQKPPENNLPSMPIQRQSTLPTQERISHADVTQESLRASRTLPKQQTPINNNNNSPMRQKSPQVNQPYPKQQAMSGRISLPNVYPEHGTHRDSSPSSSVDNSNQQSSKGKGLFIKRHDKIRMQQQQQKVNSLSAWSRSDSTLNAPRDVEEDRQSPIEQKDPRVSPRPSPRPGNDHRQHYNSTPDLLHESPNPPVTKKLATKPAPANPPHKSNQSITKPHAPQPKKNPPRRYSTSSESSSGSTETSSSSSSSEGSLSDPESDHLYSNLPADKQKPPELPPPPASTLRKSAGEGPAPPPLPEKRVSKKIEEEKRNSKVDESPAHKKRHSKKVVSPKPGKQNSIKTDSPPITPRQPEEPDYPTWKRLGKQPVTGRIVSAESPASRSRSPSPAAPPPRPVESVWTETDLDRNRETRHEDRPLRSPPKSIPSYQPVNYHQRHLSSPTVSHTDSISSPSSSADPKFFPRQESTDKNIFRAEVRYATDSSSIQSPQSDNSMRQQPPQLTAGQPIRAQFVRVAANRSPSPDLPPPPPNVLHNKPVTPSASLSSHHSQPSPPLPPPPMNVVDLPHDPQPNRPPPSERPQPNRFVYPRDNNPPPPQPTADFPHQYRPPTSLQSVYSPASPNNFDSRPEANQRRGPTSLPPSTYHYTPRELLDRESTEKDFQRRLEEERQNERFVTPEDEERQIEANERITLIRQMRDTLEQSQRSRAQQEAEQNERLRKIEAEVSDRSLPRAKSEEKARRDRLQENDNWLKQQQANRGLSGNAMSSSYDSDSHLLNNNNKPGLDMRRSYDQPSRINPPVSNYSTQNEAAASRPRYGRPRFDAPAPAPAAPAGNSGWPTSEVAYLSGGLEPSENFSGKKSVSFDRNLESVNVYNPVTPRQSESDDHPRHENNYFGGSAPPPPAPKPKPKPPMIQQETRTAVIGGQEIYRGDKKWQQDRPSFNSNIPPHAAVEKLSFRDKMKMFDPAQVEEENSKLKSSSRQRVLENQ